jgi:hypothetical protein
MFEGVSSSSIGSFLAWVVPQTENKRSAGTAKSVIENHAKRRRPLTFVDREGFLPYLESFA